MRHAFLIAAMFAIAGAMPAAAAPRQPTSVETQQDWFRCFDLGIKRGIHLENGEMPDWIDECLAGRIPFADEVQVASQRRTRSPAKRLQ